MNKFLINALADDDQPSGKEVVRACFESMVDAIEVEKKIAGTAAILNEVTTANPANPEVSAAADELFRQVALANGIRETVLSTEGIFSDLFGKMRKSMAGKKPQYRLSDENRFGKEASKNQQEVINAINKFYLNDKWLEQQKFVEGTVTAKDLSPILSVDGKISKNPLDNLEAGFKNITEFLNIWAPAVKKVENTYAAIDVKLKADIKGLKIDVKNLNGDDEENETIETLLKEAIADQLAVPSPFKHFPVMKGTGFGNVVLVHDKKHNTVEDEVRGKVASDETFPALTKEQVKIAAGWIKKLLLDEDMDVFARIDSLRWGDNSDDDDFNDIVNHYCDYLSDMYYEEWHYENASMRYIYSIYNLADGYVLAGALESWIDRSIK
jgi:hypothetical protein